MRSSSEHPARDLPTQRRLPHPELKSTLSGSYGSRLAGAVASGESRWRMTRRVRWAAASSESPRIEMDGTVDRNECTKLAELPWADVAAWLRRDPRMILPVGSCVQHGPHLPLGTDEIITTAIAEGIAARHSVLLGPTLAFGAVSGRDKAYAGTAGLSAKTLHRILNELIADWEQNGVREFTLLTSHGYGPHYGALVSAISTRARLRAVDINVVDLSPVLGPDASPERAGEVETSLMLYLAPSRVRNAVARDEVVDRGVLSKLLDGSEPMPLRGSPGVIGRPTAGTAQKGKRIYEYLVTYIGDRLFAEDVEHPLEPAG